VSGLKATARHFEERKIFSFRELKCNGTKGAEEYCWAITHLAGGGYAAADQVALFLNLDFIWTLFFLCIYMIISVFRKIRIPPIRPEGNY
jgi:hypothetical protein